MKRYFLVLLLLGCFIEYSRGCGFAVELKLKPQMSRSFSAATDVEIRALSTRHGVELRQSYPGARTPELLLYYTLTGEQVNVESAVKDFFATGKFESFVREFETIYIDIPDNDFYVRGMGGQFHSSPCANPISVNDPHFMDEHGWPLRLINVPCAWTITTGNPNVLIGIVDTGFNTEHEDLRNQIVYAFGPPGVGSSHGTAVASVAAAETNNGRGMAGVGYNSRIVTYRTSLNGAVIRTAIWNLYQMDIPIPVINVSLSSTGLNRLAAQEITESGITLVLSAGNGPRDQQHGDIADIPGVIVVSSVNQNNMHAPTNFARNGHIDICAPGTGIVIAEGDNGYRVRDGTSFAAPFVSGTVALMLSVNPNLTPAQIERIIKDTASPIADAHLFPGRLGAGLLNAYEAVKAARDFCVTNFINQNITTNRAVATQCEINVQNVTITNNARLTLDTPSRVIFSGDVQIVSGALVIQ